MMNKAISIEQKFIRSLSVVLSGALFAASAQAAQAAHGGSNGFREFRQQNAGVDRHTARQMFHAQKHGGADGVMLSPTGSAFTFNDAGITRVDPAHIARQSVQMSSAGNLVRLRSGVDLDLTSHARNITLGQNLFSGSDSVQITVGDATKTLTAGSHVSAAEYVAAKQVLSGAGQQIQVDGSGSASGGEVDLSAITANNDVMRASNLVVGSNVTTYGDFAKGSDFRLTGNLNNYGTVHAYSSDNNVRSGAIRAEDINNYSGARITSDVDLTLDAAGNLNNAGTIESTGALTLTVGGTVSNAGSVHAHNDVSIQAAGVNNLGLVQSSNGNINLDGPETLNINNTGGVLRADNGAINVRNASYNGAFDTSLSGGDLFSREVNLNSGGGLLSVNVGQLTGTVHETGTAVHLLAATELLNVGESCLTGDPTIYNTAGGINIGGNFSSPENLVFVAAGDITVGSGVTVRAGDGTAAHNMSLIAGADFQAISGSNSPNFPTTNNPGEVQLSGKASKTGGGIVLAGGASLLAESSDSVGNHDGGDIDLFAFGGKAGLAGIIDTSLGTVSTGGKNVGVDGDILMVAGRKGKNIDVVITGATFAQGGSLGDGQIQIFTAQPAPSVKEDIIFDASGNLTSSAALVAGKQNKGVNISVDQNMSASRSVEMNVGGIINLVGDVTGAQVVDLFAITGIQSVGGASTISSNSDVFLTSLGDIGGTNLADYLQVSTLNILAGTKGNNVTINLVGTGATFIHDSQSGGRLEFRGNNRTLSADNCIAANFVVAGSDIGLIDNVLASTFGVQSLTTPLTNAEIGNVIAPSWSVQGTTVGTSSVSPFVLPNNVVALGVVATTGAFVTSQATKSLDISSTTVANGDFFLRADNGFHLGICIVTNGTFDGASAAGTIELGLADAPVGGITATNGVLLANNNGKIVMNVGSHISTNNKGVAGDINISVGPASVNVPPDPSNVTITETGGTVSFTGSGLSAKKDPSAITAQGANVTINNGFKASAFLLSGDNLILADPPVAEGTPTYTRFTPGPEHKAGNTHTTFGGIMQSSTERAFVQPASIKQVETDNASLINLAAYTLNSHRDGLRAKRNSTGQDSNDYGTAGDASLIWAR